MSMTESEATKVIKGHIQFLRENWKPHPDYNVIEALGEAIFTIEEIQQYRAIGTVSEFQQLKEKATAKKPKNICADTGLFECPNCGKIQKILYQGFHCKECGQKLDWSEGKE